MTPTAADQAGQMLRQNRQAALPLEATNHHDDQGLQAEAVRIRLGSSSWPLDWSRRPWEVFNESGQPDT
jgi:hypothetical protein